MCVCVLFTSWSHSCVKAKAKGLSCWFISHMNCLQEVRPAAIDVSNRFPRRVKPIRVTVGENWNGFFFFHRRRFLTVRLRGTRRSYWPRLTGLCKFWRVFVHIRIISGFQILPAIWLIRMNRIFQWGKTYLYSLHWFVRPAECQYEQSLGQVVPEQNDTMVASTTAS